MNVLPPLTACLFLLLMPSGSVSEPGPLEVPNPVEVWCGGDDGLTLKVCNAVEQAFRTAHDLPLLKAEENPKYKIVIPTNVDWKKERGRLQILYTVELQNADSKELGHFRGSCSESKVRACGIQILQRTRSLLTVIARQ